MVDEQPEPPRPAPAVLPAEPVPPGSGQPPSAWPTIIGIISVVLGGLGAVGAIGSTVMALFMSGVADGLSAAKIDTTGVEALQKWKPWTLGSSVLTLAAAVLLFVAGLQILRRRRSARKLSLTWSVLKIPLVGVNSVIGYLVQQGQFEAMMNNPNNPAAPMMGSMMGVVGAMGLVIGVLWGWALPVFVLIWFCRSRIKEEVATWP